MSQAEVQVKAHQKKRTAPRMEQKKIASRVRGISKTYGFASSYNGSADRRRLDREISLSGAEGAAARGFSLGIRATPMP